MAMMKVPSAKDIANRKPLNSNSIKNATHYQSNCGLPIRKEDLKTGKNSVFEYVQKRDIKKEFKKGK